MQSKMTIERIWWNGWLSATLGYGAVLLGTGLWSHGFNSIVCGAGIMLLASIFWLVTVFG
jgi:hypothetical protein